MSKLFIRNGKSLLKLSKSQELVGLKAKDQETSLADQDFVKADVLPHLGGFNVVTLNHESSTDDKLDEVRQADEVEVGTHVYLAEGSQRPIIPTGELYIIFHESTNPEEQQIVLDEYHLELMERRGQDRLVAKVTALSPNPLKVAQALESSLLVRYVEPDIDTVLDSYDTPIPSDDLLDHQWHLRNGGRVVDANWRLREGADAKVVEAWNRIGNTGSDEVVVAVIDNGFDLTHPDLKDKVFRPLDLWTQSSNLETGNPNFTHGTPCASVALSASNGKGIVGVAPNSKFMPISGTSFSLRATEDMFNYCIKNGADIISCSWGTTDPAFSLSPLKAEVITKAAKEGRNGKGCVVLYAVGNEDLDFVNYYSAHPDVIAVGASTSQDSHASYSNRGRELSVVAPSNGDWPIIAARAWWDQGVSWETGNFRYWRDGKSRGDRYKHFGGTSSACPLVAGICSLMLSVNPDLTAKEVKTILQDTADKIGNPSEYVNGHSVKYGYGRVNADKAVAESIRRLNGNTGSGTVVDPPVIQTGRGLFHFSVAPQKYEGFGVQIGAFAEYGNVLIAVEALPVAYTHLTVPTRCTR